MMKLLHLAFVVVGVSSQQAKIEAANKAHADYVNSLKEVDWTKVKSKLRDVMTSSEDWWPADYGHYGPLFIRLAWHASGSYRTSDGRGGVDGARQRFDPERSWKDNANLDKARGLLWSVKEAFPLVSWSDLIVLAGNEALESMGAPVLGFCAGRVDDPDGSESILLGPNDEQEAFAPCPVNGKCEEPLGSTTIGLIYVNPEGPMGEPDANNSAPQVRDTFKRMDMNDSETVALIGGGHAFGKTHGACPFGPGPTPAEDPQHPWPGNCGTGCGEDTFTSGIEGPWTTKPTVWDNEYFHSLRNLDWTPYKGPGGAWQWKTVASEKNPVAPSASLEGTQNVMMMTTDVSLKTDPEYFSLVQHFADDLDALNFAFSNAWYKLTTRDMGPYTRCASNSPELPPPQPFQNHLAVGVLESSILEDAKKALRTEFNSNLESRATAINYAYACASTFRQTDYLGGCNGARIRFEPATKWQGYATLVEEGTTLLEPIKKQFSNITWADLIVLAGGVALETSADSLSLDFCGGRVDDIDGSAWSYLKPAIFGNVNETAASLKELILRTGLTNTDFIALLGARRSIGNATFPFYGAFSSNPTVLDNTYFKDLLDSEYEAWTAPYSDYLPQYKSKSSSLFATQTDINVKYDAELSAIAQNFATNNADFISSLASAWPKLMNADRFDSPTCLPGLSSPTVSSSSAYLTASIF